MLKEMLKSIVEEVLLGEFAGQATEEKTAEVSRTDWPGRYIVRGHSAGVWFGEIVSQKDREVIMRNARMIHYWHEAAALSEIAKFGHVGSESRLTVLQKKIRILDACEIYEMSVEAFQKMSSKPEWRANP